VNPGGEGPATPPGPNDDDTPGEQAVAFGDAVAVPVVGDFLVRDGKVIPIDESELVSTGSDHYAYTVWVAPEVDDD
jgi:hypothetical protein